MKLSGARILVTGASSGIGAAFARAAAARGARVGLVARRADRLEQVRAACPAPGPGLEPRAWVHDLADTEGAERLALEAWDAFGGLDVLVNNAAVPVVRRLPETGVDELLHAMKVNFEAPVRMILALLPRMIERGAGAIVNVSSMGGRHGIPAEAAYCASKFALTGFSEVMHIDLQGTGVRTLLVNPGPIDTEIWDRPGTEPASYDGPLHPPELVADGMIAALEGEGFEHYFPGDMEPIVEMKNRNVEGFLDGVARYAREREDGRRAGSTPSP